MRIPGWFSVLDLMLVCMAVLLTVQVLIVVKCHHGDVLACCKVVLLIYILNSQIPSFSTTYKKEAVNPEKCTVPFLLCAVRSPKIWTIYLINYYWSWQWISSSNLNLCPDDGFALCSAVSVWKLSPKKHSLFPVLQTAVAYYLCYA